MKLESFKAALGMTMFVGAARADASPAQLERLRKLAEGALQDYMLDGNWSAARALVQEVMGAEWVPGAEWRQHGA